MLLEPTVQIGGPSDFGTLASSSGSATLNRGTLTVEFSGGFVPALNDSFAIVTVASRRSGTFPTPDLTGIATVQFNSGSMNLTEADLRLTDSQILSLADGNLHVLGTFTMESSSTVQVNGGMPATGGLAGACVLTFSDSGTYILGNGTNSASISLTGTWGVGTANVNLIDPAGVELGISTMLAGGTLGSLTGFALESGDVISGHGRLFDNVDLDTNGAVAGSGTGLTLYGNVSGSGTLSDTTLFGNLNIGSSPGAITLENVTLSPSATTTFEIAGIV